MGWNHCHRLTKEIQMSQIKYKKNFWLAIAGAVFAVTAALPQAVTAQELTYTADVAPIVQANCALSSGGHGCADGARRW